MKPTSVVPVDPAGGREFDVSDRLEWAVVEHSRANAFGFVEPVDRLHQGVIVRIADGPDRGRDAIEREFLSVGQRDVLRAGVRMRSQLLRLDRVALPAALPETHP